jgi:predicted dehydrogenase
MRSSTPYRIGVLGAGWFASRRHIPEIVQHPDLQLAALCRRDEAQLKSIRDQLAPETPLFTDWREMLDKANLDILLIATPHALHYEQAKAALERGLHLLVEKPMTVRSEEARDLCRMADTQGALLGVALNPPYWAHCHRIREWITGGDIGKLEAVSIFWTGNAEYVFGSAPRPADLPGVVSPTMYRADPQLCGGGYFIDGGSHLISEILFVSGQRAVSVTCQMDATPSDRRAVVTMILESGALVSVICVGDSKSGGRRVSNIFAGSNGTIRVEGFDFRTTLERGAETQETFRERDLPSIPGPVTNFVDALSGRAPLFSTAQHGAQVVAVIEAAYRSAETGQTVRLT